MTDVITIVVALFASTGFWTFINTLIMNRSNRTKETLVERKLIVNATRGELFCLIRIIGEKFVQEGEITVQELADFDQYLVEPYLALDGNGGGKTMINLVHALPVKTDSNT